ncbi:hypothetical protein A3862_04280 [Methylobacterium sp. XJLW]|nr:hypothetical protein A3862_04280 [Methylobacterium sp. XJLW]
MRWTRAVRPAKPGLAGEGLDRIVRDVSTDDTISELDTRLDEAGLTARLSPDWLDGLRLRKRRLIDGIRYSTPGDALDPEDAEDIVQAALDEARQAAG